MMVKDKDVPPLLLNLATDLPTAKTLSITDSKDQNQCIPSEADILLLFKAADKFTKDNSKLPLLHATAFYRHPKAFRN